MKALSVLWRGALIGAADIVPGVSGGTMALITGVYEQLTTLIASVVKLPKRLYEQRSFEPIKNINYSFAIPLIIGVVAAFIAATQLLVPLITQQPGYVYAVFCGLILGAALMLILYNTHKLAHTLTGIAGFILGLGALLLPHTDAAPTPIFLFILGIAAGFVMLFPGVSGSYLLLVTGHYALLLAAIGQPFANAVFLITFGAGVLIGIGLAALCVQYVLRIAREHTLLFLSGLMLGALITPLITIHQATTGTTGWMLVTVLFAVGTIAAVGMQLKASTAGAQSSQN